MCTPLNEPGDDVEARTDLGDHHGTLVKAVSGGIFLSKLLHIFQSDILWPIKLNNHFLVRERRIFNY